MKTKRIWFVALLLAAIVAVCVAQSTGNPAGKGVEDKQVAAVKKMLARAENARKTGDLPKAIKLYEKVIVAAPDNQKGHSGLLGAVFMSERNRLKAESDAVASSGGTALSEEDLSEKTMKASRARLAAIYRRLVASHPGVTVYRYYLAIEEHASDGKLKDVLEQIVSDDPKCAPALSRLGSLADSVGDVEKEREYYRRASAAQPDSDQYAFSILRSYRIPEPQEFRRLLEQFANRFPDSIFVGLGLQEAADDAPTPEERLALLERVADRPGAFFVNEFELLMLYARTDVTKAAALAQKKLDETRKEKGEEAKYAVDSLTKQVEYYGGIVHAQELLKAGQFAEAKAAIDKVSVEALGPYFRGTFPKTKVTTDILLAQGKPEDAYKYLLDQHETIADADLTAIAVKIGAQLGKTEAQVRGEIATAFLAAAKPFQELEVESLKREDKIKLSSLRGRYVIINTWHPT